MKKFLSSKKFAPKPGYLDRVPDVELTDAHKDFIKTHIAKGGSSLDLAREVFGDPGIQQLSKRHRTVDTYVKTLDPGSTGAKPPVTYVDTPYVAPRSPDGTLQRLNKFLHTPIDKERLSAAQKKGIEYLTNHLNSPRFLRTINGYSETQDRDSFESEFSRLVWDKPDLTPEEIGLYINLCADFIMMFKIQAQIDALDQRLREVMSDPEGKITMGLTEAIGKKTKEYDDCFGRHNRLIADLTGKRSTRISKDVKDNATVLAIIQAFKQEEERAAWALMAKAKEKEVVSEINRLESMDELKAASWASE